MTTTFYLALTIGVFLWYIAVLIYRQKKNRLLTVLFGLLGLMAIGYAIYTTTQPEVTLHPERVEQRDTDLNQQTIDPPPTQVEPPPERAPDGSIIIPQPDFQGDPQTAQYLANGWYAKAVALWSSASGSYRQPDSVLYYINKALSYYSFAAAYNVKGQVTVQLGQFNNAVRFYDMAILLDSSQGQPFFNRGTAYYIMNNHPEACSNWKKAASLGMSNAEIAIQTYCK